MVQSSIFLQLFTLTTILLVYEAKSNQNISSGSSLTPLGVNSHLLSPSGDFAFGFLPLDNNSNTFLLAIWYAKIPSRTTVWYANGDNPVESTAYLQLSSNNQFTLYDKANKVIWSSGNSNINSTTNTSHAAILDTGNLVVIGSDGSTQWQSFENPSDTILPSQTLAPDARLLARLMENDYSNGRFKLSFGSDGNLVLYEVVWPSGNQYDSYWSSNTGGNGTLLVFDVSGRVYVSLKTNTTFNVTSALESSADDFYQRATLDADGVFRQYVYAKNGSTSSGVLKDGWSIVDFVPDDICQAIRTDVGSGACGYNSYCSFNQSRAECLCPPNYSFADPDRKYKGCLPDFSPQSCVANESETQNLFTFVDVIDLDFPLADYEHYYPVDKDTCQKQCLMDCFCAVAIYNDGDCWKKKLPLTNGHIGSFVNRVAYIKVPAGPSLQAPFPRKDERTWKIIGSTFLGSSLLVNFLLFTAVVFITNCKRRSRNQTAPNLSVLNLQSFRYSELKAITNGFSQELGRGSFGVVYKGFLQDEVRTCVAVKKLNNVTDKAEVEFMNEMKAIAKTHHKNLVRLLGFCNEGCHKLMVYEFMSNGTLIEFLRGVVRPDWNKRMQIALGIARGLTYLHEECANQIIHCDIKPQNILLDDNLVARISDFGLAKLMKTDQTRTNTDIRGTRGYIAPEWFKSRSITAKVDVYSFGIILLEIVCCRANVACELEDEENAILSYWVDDCYREGKLSLVVEGDEEAILDMKRVERFVKVALWCIQGEPSLRPTMTKVTQMLDGAVPVPIPPDLGSYMSSI